MVSSDNLYSYAVTNHEVPHSSHYCLQQAWIKEDDEEALSIMQDALYQKREENMDAYIKFISHFGPALTGTTFWNNNRTTKLVSDLLTITDEAFIHLCIINYSATWKAQDKKKSGETDVQVPVSDSIHCVLVCDYCTDQQLTNSIVIASLLGSPRLPTRLINWSTMKAQATCHVDGLKKASKPSTNWPKKFTKTAMSMERNSTRPSRRALRKKWPAPPTKLEKERETVLKLTMI